MAPVLPPRPLQKNDDRSNFDCGRASLNNWFQRHAWNNHKSGASRINVICDQNTGRIIGYVSLSAAQIERAFLAKSQQRNQPDPLPVTLLGQLAVDQQHQGEGHARSLLLFALKTAVIAAISIGSIGVITHPIDEDVRTFYEKWGFKDLPFDPHRAMMVRIVDLKKNGVKGNT